AEGSYAYRQSHWPRWERANLLEWSHAEFETTWPSRVAGLIEADADAALDGLLEWLGDQTSLKEHEATVADAAASFLLYHRDLFFDRLCDALADSPHPTARALLNALADREPERFATVLGTWLNTQSDGLVLSMAARFRLVPSPRLDSIVAPILTYLCG